MDEIRNRLNELKAEAEKASQELTGTERAEKLKALAEERTQLLAQFEVEKVAAVDAAALAEGAPEEPEAPAEAEPEAEPEAPAEAPAEEPAEAPEAIAAAAASAQPVDVVVPEASAAAEANPLVLVAAGNVGGTSPGVKVSAEDLGRIHRHAGRHNPGKAGEIKSIYGTLSSGRGDKAVSESFSPERNTALMASASSGNQSPITAAAAFCGPDDIVLDICAAGVTDRPVQDLFRTVPVRGRFRYMKTATRTQVRPGVDVWEEQDQLDLDVDVPSTWKPCVDLSCRDETLVTPYAIVGCTTIGVWQQLSAPEQIENWLRIMRIEYASQAEQALLDRVRAQSKVFSAGTTGHGLWNLTNTLLAYVESAVGAVNRDTTEGYVLVAPYGFTAALAADEILRGFSQNKGVQRIQDLLRENYGVRIVESYEVDSTVAASYNTGATAIAALADGGAATAFDQNGHAPDTWPIYVLNPDSFVGGDSDVVDAGYYRDGTLVRQNLVRYFWEGMEFLEKTCDNLAFTFELTTCPNGTASALIAAPDCAGTL